jgi:ABC-type Na+ transport system ATPase subunit NatA
MASATAPDCGQQFLLPPALEDWGSADHPARCLPEFVDQLDSAARGFVLPVAVEGRPPYHPSLLLIIWLDGYPTASAPRESWRWLPRSSWRRRAGHRHAGRHGMSVLVPPVEGTPAKGNPYATQQFHHDPARQSVTGLQKRTLDSEGHTTKGGVRVERDRCLHRDCSGRAQGTRDPRGRQIEVRPHKACRNGVASRVCRVTQGHTPSRIVMAWSERARSLGSVRCLGRDRPVPPGTAATHMNAVELDQVTKTFGKTLAVDDLSLHVPEGCTYGFIGPNGSGKTTTLRMILNIFRPDSGDVRLFGEPLRGSRDSRVGYLPEERGLYPRMKVREILNFFGELKLGRSPRAEVDEWLARFEIGAWADRRVEALSKGMAQKVQFVAAVIGAPRLLVLDEPFSGLDPVNTDVLRQAVLDLRQRGTTLIFSTHDMEMAERLCEQGRPDWI